MTPDTAITTLAEPTHKKTPGVDSLIGASTHELRIRSGELLSRLNAWITEDPKTRTNKYIGRRIGYSEATISRYRGQGYLGDLDKVEAAIIELLLDEARRANVLQEVEPFETEATRQLARHLDIIRAKPQIGAVVGEAGYGKTCGIHLYREVHAQTTLLITASPLFGAGASSIVNGLWPQIDTRGYKNRESRGQFLVNRLKASKRLVIIDDAHELHEAGRRAVKSLFDHTNCSVALVGNPKIRQQWMADDQNGSRVGFVGEVRLLGKKKGKIDPEDIQYLRPAVRTFLEKVWPDAAHLEQLAIVVAKHAGHMRALWLQCSLAMHLIDMDKQHGRELHTMARQRGISIQEQAFRTAHHQLVRGYELPA